MKVSGERREARRNAQMLAHSGFSLTGDGESVNNKNPRNIRVSILFGRALLTEGVPLRHVTTTSSPSNSTGPIAAAAHLNSAHSVPDAKGQVFNHQRARRIWILCVVMVLCWLFSGIASGQKYEVIDSPAAQLSPEQIAGYERATKTLSSTRKKEQLTDDVLRGATIYVEHVVPYQIVRKENLNKMGPMLASLEKSLTNAQRINNPGKTELLKRIYNGMNKVATGNYIPAARINAILVLGRLDSNPYDGATGRPPVPLAAGFAPLFNTLVGLYENEEEVDGVRAAALQALHRTAMYGFTSLKDAPKAKLTQLMTDLLDAPAPEGRDPKAHAYLQRSAVDILHYIGTPDDTSLGKQLISISTDEEKPDLIALYSAAQLGDMTTQLKGQVADTDGVLKSWSRRAFDTVESELKRLQARDRNTTMTVKQPPNPETFLGVKEEKKKKKDKSRAGGSMMGGGMGMGMDMDMGMGMDSMMEGGMDMDMGMGSDMMMEGGMGMGMGMGMMGGMPAAKPQPPEVSLSRRRITYVLQQIMQGAVGSPEAEIPKNPRGLIAAASDEDKKVLTSWVDDIRPIAEAINDDQLDDKKKWLDSLEEQRVSLAKLAGVELTNEDEEGDNFDGILGGGLPGMGGGGLPVEQPAGGGLPNGAPAGAAGDAGLPVGGGLPVN
ncbi:hypothetical protein RBSH_01292 [Rhodopirellula baltica SH28]|uniref:Uncharacterized protein n=1 Tax=Rhodopirellula baltica SH28 TaxID=993517 RepID=K5DLP3_RHOBT|nr:hypothetical protein [Rhodopirellula baltica]EKK03373.1 hypothetical protein RBSH_01292 [Rhodopirellula baltica SH28]